MKFIDAFLNRVTMYRLVLYELGGLIGAAVVMSALGLLPFAPFSLLLSTAYITAVVISFNALFARLFEAPSNPESSYITAFILALLISPPSSLADPSFFILAFWAGAWAAASKYILAIRDRHIFNPATLGIFATGVFLGQPASWWVGTGALLPFVALGGFLVVQKIKRFDMVLSFLAAAGVVIIFSAVKHSLGFLQGLENAFIFVPTVFFATVMLTEPLTTPPTRARRIFYGILVGFLFYPDLHIGGMYMTPEIALLIGNVLSCGMSSKEKITLTLVNRLRLSPTAYEFVFAANRSFSFHPGQYLEWTLPHARRDARGIRRYFTITSAPSEKNVRVGIKFYAPSSSFKEALATLPARGRIVAAHPAGDFTLPRDPARKIAFIAGGIGITPFISMMRFLMRQGIRRDIVLLYMNKTKKDFPYKNLIDQARVVGVRTVYLFSHESSQRKNSSRLSAADIQKEVPDFPQRIFYLSGPHGFVVAMRQELRTLGIPSARIKTDYFPGLA